MLVIMSTNTFNVSIILCTPPTHMSFTVDFFLSAVFFLITDIGFMIGLTVLSTKAFMMVSSAYFCMIAALVFAGICSLVAKKQSKQAEKAGRPKRTPKVKLRTRKLEVEDVEDEDNDVEDVEGVEVSDQEDEVDVDSSLDVDDENNCFGILSVLRWCIKTKTRRSNNTRVNGVAAR